MAQRARDADPDQHVFAVLRDDRAFDAHDGVERGNIVGWRQDVAAALAGRELRFGATLDRRSIFYSTVGLFAAAVAIALGLLAATIYIVRRKGQRAR